MFSLEGIIQPFRRTPLVYQQIYTLSRVRVAEQRGWERDGLFPPSSELSDHRRV